jgi:hypothetical protein
MCFLPPTAEAEFVAPRSLQLNAGSPSHSEFQSLELRGYDFPFPATTFLDGLVGGLQLIPRLLGTLLVG